MNLSRQARPCVRQASVRQVCTAVALSTVRSAVVGTVSTARTDLRYDVARFVQEEHASADRAVRADQYPAYRMYHTPAVRMRRRRFELRGTACKHAHVSAYTHKHTRCGAYAASLCRAHLVGEILDCVGRQRERWREIAWVTHYPPTPPRKRQCCTGCADAYTPWRVPWESKCVCGTASTGTVTLAHGRAGTVGPRIDPK